MDDRWAALFDEVYGQKFENSDMNTQQETLRKRAVAARPILVQLAEAGEPGDEELVTTERNTTTYGQLAEEVGSGATYVPKVLGAIDPAGEELGDPPLSPLVESSGTVGPRRGYFNWKFHGEDRIRNPGDKDSLGTEMKKTWRQHLRTVYEHDDWYQPE